MEAVASAAKSTKTNSEEAIAAIRQHGVAVAEQQNARKALELAKVNAAESGGKITGAEAIQQRLGIEDKYSRRKLVTDIETKDAEIEAKRQQVQRMNEAANREEQAAEAARKEYEDAQRDQARFTALKSGTDKALVETTKQVAAISGATFIGPGQIGQLDTARALQSQLRTRAGLLQGQEPGYADAVQAARERYEGAMGRAKELRGGAADLAGRIPGEQALANQGYRDAGEVASTERLTRTYGAAGELGKQQQQLTGEIQKAVEAMSGVSVASLQQLKAVTAALAAIQKQINALAPSANNRNL
jgi:hypothetical protein